MSCRWLIALAPLVLAGCYLSHSDSSGPTPARPDASIPRADAAMDARVPRDDGGVRVDDAGRVDAASDASACPGSALGVEVRVEPVSSMPGACDATHVVGVAIDRVEPAPADRGIRIHADYCPDADADCRCDLVVANVGTDLADRVLVPSAGLTVDLGSTWLHVTTVPTCECLGCPCSYELVLDAEDALLGPGSPELQIEQGGLVCPSSATCSSPTWTIRASSAGDSVEIPAGTDGVVAGIVNVRSVRDVDIFGPCAACAGCGSPEASWVAWIRH